MSTVTFEIIGFRDVGTNLRILGGRAVEAARKECVSIKESVVEDIKLNYVPVYVGPIRRHITPGALRDSVDGDVEVTAGGGMNGAIVIRIWAGGGGSVARAYARVQHERLDFRHAIGQAKYIEVPLMKAATGVTDRVSTAVRSALG